jgi:N-acetylglucosaminyldiphosphoundecaprenol N-acetyl-beta-D-mannosaminyltransferase
VTVIASSRTEPPAAAAASSRVLGMRVDATSYEDAERTVLDWAARAESRYVCVSTVHMTMEAYDSPEYRQVVNAADLVTPDGMPMVWSLRVLGHRGQRRVYGPDLTVCLLEAAAREGVPVGFYGSRPEVLDRLLAEADRRFPGLSVAYAQSPPFRTLSDDERRATVEDINRSGARILFVGLGCPKQERWMAEHRGRVGAVMLGVGAAFDFLAGTTRQAPRWVMAAGLEWLFRLMVEPRRLWKRYVKNNPRFVGLFVLQVLRLKAFS